MRRRSPAARRRKGTVPRLRSRVDAVAGRDSPAVAGGLGAHGDPIAVGGSLAAFAMVVALVIGPVVTARPGTERTCKRRLRSGRSRQAKSGAQGRLRPGVGANGIVTGEAAATTSISGSSTASSMDHTHIAYGDSTPKASRIDAQSAQAIGLRSLASRRRSWPVSRVALPARAEEVKTSQARRVVTDRRLPADKELGRGRSAVQLRDVRHRRCRAARISCPARPATASG